MLFRRPQLSRAPITRTTALAACLVIGAAAIALPSASELLAGAVRGVVQTVEVVLDSPSIGPSTIILASGAAGTPGGAVVSTGRVSGPQPAVAQADGGVTSADPMLLAILVLLTANLFAFGGRQPRRRDPPPHERYRIYRT